MICSETDMLLMVGTRGQLELVLFSIQSNAYQHYSLPPRKILSVPIPLFCPQVQRSGFILLGNEQFSAQEATTSKYILRVGFFSGTFMKLSSKAEPSLFFKQGIFLCAKAGLYPFLWKLYKILESKDEKEKAEYILNRFLHEVQFVSLIVLGSFKININHLHRENFSSWNQ